MMTEPNRDTVIVLEGPTTSSTVDAATIQINDNNNFNNLNIVEPKPKRTANGLFSGRRQQHESFDYFDFFRNFFKSYGISLMCFIIYNLFLVYACHVSWHKTATYCEGIKFLVLITMIIYLCLLKDCMIDPYIVPAIQMRFDGIRKIETKYRIYWKLLARSLIFATFATIIGIRCWHQPERLLSVGGYFGFIFCGYIFSVNFGQIQGHIILADLDFGFFCSHFFHCSFGHHQKHRKHINWNQVVSGFTIQILFGIFVLRTQIGKQIFLCVGQKINTFLDFTKSGTRLVFGYLATGVVKGTRPGNYTAGLYRENNGSGTGSQEPAIVELPSLPLEVQNSIFAISGMPVIIFFSFFISILYHYGIMQIIVRKFGSLLQSTIGTTPCESISASGNIFLGMCESPLLVKPFISSMTKSELHAVMTGGFATIAGAVMAAYISFGISASHLLSASVMAAPSALALSKLLYPESEQSKTKTDQILVLEKGPERNAIEAGSKGATSAVGLIASILANLIAFISFLTFLDSVIGYLGATIGLPGLSFKMILSKLFIPIALMLGVEWSDAESIAGLIGVKMFINEFVAYQELAQLINQSTISQRSQTIATFALCGFANLSSIGIQVGSLSTLAPSRASDLAEMAFSAMLTGTVACFTTACVAGMLI